MNHPNRNPNNDGASPTPGQILRARMVAALTPEEAAALVHERPVRWLRFEAGEARMHPATWELFQIKARLAE